MARGVQGQRLDLHRYGPGRAGERGGGAGAGRARAVPVLSSLLSLSPQAGCTTS